MIMETAGRLCGTPQETQYLQPDIEIYPISFNIPQPSGIPGFSIEEGDGIITVTYLGSSYTLVKAQWQISSGNWHTLFVSPEGNLYGTGQNSYGQLGLGDNNNRNTLYL